MLPPGASAPPGNGQTRLMRQGVNDFVEMRATIA
jgi:hypothetical protein